MADGVLSGIPSLMTMSRTRGASALGDEYLRNRAATLGDQVAGIEDVSRDIEKERVTQSLITPQAERGNLAAEEAQAERTKDLELTSEDPGFYTGAEDLMRMRDIISIDDEVRGITGSKVVGGVAQKALETLASATPVGAAYSFARTALGTLAATTSAVEEGWVGDLMDTRHREAERDVVEDYGGYTDVAGMARTDNKTRALGLDDSIFGLSAAYETTAASQLGSIAAGILGDVGSMFGGSDEGSSFGDWGVDTDVSSASGVSDIGSTGTTSLGSLSASLAEDAPTGEYDWGGGDDGGNGDDRGHDSSGGMGGASDRDSEPGGMGGV